MACEGARKHVLSFVSTKGSKEPDVIESAMGWWTRETLIEAFDELIKLGKIVSKSGWYYPVMEHDCKS